MSLPHALLGLLIVEPRSGYELTKAFEGDLGRHAWQAGHTSIYPELGRLAESGLIEVSEEGARGSRTYAATDAGRAELKRWLLTRDTATKKVRNEQVLRMFLINALEPEDAIRFLRGVAESTSTEAERLAGILAEHGPVTQRGRAGFGLLAAEFGRRQYEAVHGWALWAIERLETADQAEENLSSSASAS
jgi:DNA-binding PadR family transcriptional regulator